jgi:hypothetical protein
MNLWELGAEGVTGSAMRASKQRKHSSRGKVQGLHQKRALALPEERKARTARLRSRGLVN